MSLLHNLLSNIQTGIIVRKKQIDVPRTKLNLEVLKLLHSQGFLNGYAISKEKINCFVVFLKYINNKPVLKEFKIISTSSRRVYISRKKIINELIHKGLFVISTSNRGLVFTDDFFKDLEKKSLLGGELLFQIIF